MQQLLKRVTSSLVVFGWLSFFGNIAAIGISRVDRKIIVKIIRAFFKMYSP